MSGIGEHADPLSSGDRLVEELKPLQVKLACEQADACRGPCHHRRRQTTAELKRGLEGGAVAADSDGIYDISAKQTNKISILRGVANKRASISDEEMAMGGRSVRWVKAKLAAHSRVRICGQTPSGITKRELRSIASRAVREAAAKVKKVGGRR
jgi:hypothetical protein